MPRALWTTAPWALLRHRVGLLAVLCAALLVALGAAAGPLLNAGAQSEALQSKLAQLTPLGAGLMIDRPPGIDTGDSRAIAAADAQRRAAAAALGRRLPFVGRPVLTTTTPAQFSGLQFYEGNPSLVAMARTGARAHVHRLAGGGPGVWLSNAITHRAGGRVTLVSTVPGTKRIRLPVGAVYRRLDSDLANPYWVNFTALIRAQHADSSPPPSFALVTDAQIYRIAHTLSGNELANVFEYPVDARSMTPARAKQIARAFADVKRRIAARSTLAASLGCADPAFPCRVSSELSDAVSLASANNSSLGPVIDLLTGFCILIALGAAIVAGAFTGRRRAAEARLSLVRGEPRGLFFVRSAIEAALPAVCGAAVGFAFAVELGRLFTPQGSVDAGVVRQAAVRVAVSVASAVLAVAVGVTAARGRFGSGRSAWRSVTRLPWELVVAAAAIASWLVVRSGGGLVKDPVAGSHPRLVVLLLPALVAVPLTGLVGRAFRSKDVRRARIASTAGYLAARRVTAARGLGAALTVTVAAGVASLAFAEILQSSLSASSTEKAFVANGSDVQGIIDPTKSLPRHFPYPLTRVGELVAAGQLSSGQSVDVMTVDPASLGPVLAAHWPRNVRAAVAALGTAKDTLPAIAVGTGGGRQVVVLGGAPTTVHVVARLRAFPGMRPSQPLLVVPAKALRNGTSASFDYIWASGPPRRVEAALLRSGLSPQYLTTATDLSRAPDVRNITRTYGFLRIIASAIVLLSLVALMLYLNSRERAQLVTSAFLRRMGFSQRSQAWSVALESILLVAFATISGLAGALLSAGAIVRHVDPLSEYAPTPVPHVPWALLSASAVAVTIVAGLVGAIVTLLVRRSNVGEQLRVS